jgi:putative SOS response-associated peptidase YedK
MCGRYASARSTAELGVLFGADAGDVDAEPDWNVAPTERVRVAAVGAAGRTLTAMRWGLVPAWADDPSAGARMVNARVETVLERPAFREAIRRRRCLVPADGWYEWARLPDGQRRPHFLSPADGAVLALAGVWECWRDADGRALLTVAILTGPAPAELRHIHDRAPVAVPPHRWDDWLARDVAPDLAAVGTPRVRAWPVGPEVGRVTASGPGLAEPVAVPEQDALF